MRERRAAARGRELGLLTYAVTSKCRLSWCGRMYVPCTKGVPPNIAVVVLMSLPLAKTGKRRRRPGMPVSCTAVRIAAPSKRLLEARGRTWSLKARICRVPAGAGWMMLEERVGHG